MDDKDSLAALNRAVDLGVNFFDTADVYGDGRSERLLAQLKRERKEEIVIATKAGRRLNPHVASGYTGKNITAFIERSLQNLETDTLDLVQLHCPPTEVYYYPELFGTLDDLIAQGKIRYYGASVEKVEEAIKAIEYPDVQTVQIIFNIFRQRPVAPRSACMTRPEEQFERKRVKLLKEIAIDVVGAWGFEPQTPTVSR